MDELSPERILDQLRTRIAGLVQALSRLQISLDPANPAAIHPLPPWEEIEDLKKAVTSHLTELYDIIGDRAKAEFLKQAHVYPTPQYPQQAEFILEQLLRKRLHPSVQDWIDQGVKLGQDLEVKSAATNGGADVGDGKLEELWDWAGPASARIAVEMFPEVAGEEEDDEVEEDLVAQRKGKETGNAGQPMMALHDILKFTVSPDG